MDRDTALAALRAHERELKAAGIVSLSVFGSVARGEGGADSDVDVVVRLSDEAAAGGFAYFGRIDAMTQRLRDILGRPVDLVTEPVRHEGLRRAIAKEGALAF
jgi:hypothetical protein